MTDVFVSYASADRDRVAPLVREIEAGGWSVWWDRRIDAGRAFDREIEQAIDRARCIVVVWSEQSVDSDWVRTEASEGLERGTLVPVSIDPVRPPLAFRRTQTIDLSAEAASSDQLLDAIARFAPRGGAGSGGDGALVGREREVRTLQAALARTRDGGGGLFLVSGEAGVGKSRLLAEISGEAEALGFFVLGGECQEAEGAPPYQPLIHQLEQAMRVVDAPRLRAGLGANAPEMARLMPELRQRYDDIDEPIELPPDQERRFLLHGCGEFIARSASDRPMLLLFEDLHWAGESTCVLLAYLAERLRDAPVLLLGSYRDSDLQTRRPFARTLNDLLRRRLASELRLARLDEAQIAELIEARAGQPPPAALLRLVHAETEGNPFFVEELYRHLEDGGKLFDDAGRFRTDVAVGDTEVPRSVRLIIEQRLERSSDACRRLLSLAAVAGRQVDYSLLMRLSDLDEDTLLDALEEAVAAHLLEERSSGRDASYQFVHEQIRQTLLGLLSAPRRQRMHLRVGEALEAASGDAAADRAGELAWHFYQAGSGADDARTRQHLLAAARRAAQAVAFEEALDWLDKLDELLAPDAPVEQAEAELLRATALRGDARPEEALAALARAIEAAGDAVLITDLLRARAQLLVDLYRGQEALVHVDRLLELARARGDRALELVATRIRADACYRISLDDPDQARPALMASERNIELARELGEERALARALLDSVHFIDYWTDFRRQARRNLEEATRLAAHIGDEDLILDCNTMSLRASLFLVVEHDFDPEGTRERLEARRDPIRLKEHLFWMITSTREAGDLERCVQLADQSIDLAARLGVAPVQYPTFKAKALFALGRMGEGRASVEAEVADGTHRFGAALQRLGRLAYNGQLGLADEVEADALPLLEEVVALNRGWMVGDLGAVAGRALAEAGRLEALGRLVEATAAFEGVESHGLEFERLLAAGDGDGAIAFASRLRAGLERGHWRVMRAETAEPMVRALVAQGAFDDALALAGEVVPTAEGWGHRTLAWRLRARAALAAAASGDEAGARDQASRALEHVAAIAASIDDAGHRQRFERHPLLGQLAEIGVRTK